MESLTKSFMQMFMTVRVFRRRESMYEYSFWVLLIMYGEL